MQLLLDEYDLKRLLSLALNEGWYSEKCIKVLPKVSEDSLTFLNIEDKVILKVELGLVP